MKMESLQAVKMNLVSRQFLLTLHSLKKQLWVCISHSRVITQMETLDKDNFQRFKYLLTSYNLEKLLGTCLKVKILFKPQKNVY